MLWENRGELILRFRKKKDESYENIRLCLPVAFITYYTPN